MAVDALPAFCKARVLILGVGNLLFGDDGFGCAVIERLGARFVIPDDIYAMDAGTGVRKLLFTLGLSEELPEEIVIVDAVDGGRGDFQVGVIDAEALPEANIDDFSLHQAPSSNLLRELRRARGVAITVLACDVGVVPQRIEPGLSAGAARAVEEAARLVAERFGLAERPPG